MTLELESGDPESEAIPVYKVGTVSSVCRTVCPRCREAETVPLCGASTATEWGDAVCQRPEGHPGSHAGDHPGPYHSHFWGGEHDEEVSSP